MKVKCKLLLTKQRTQLQSQCNAKQNENERNYNDRKQSVSKSISQPSLGRLGVQSMNVKHWYCFALNYFMCIVQFCSWQCDFLLWFFAIFMNVSHNNFFLSISLYHQIQSRLYTIQFLYSFFHFSGREKNSVHSNIKSRFQFLAQSSENQQWFYFATQCNQNQKSRRYRMFIVRHIVGNMRQSQAQCMHTRTVKK